MRITGWRSSRRLAGLGFCALLMALIGISSAAGEEVQPASALTVDDFFADYLDIWCGIYTVSQESTDENPASFNAAMIKTLSKRVERDEAKYGHLPEYWELAACIKPDPTAININSFLLQESPDRAKLEKALDLYKMQVSTSGEEALLGAAEAGVLNALRDSDVNAASYANERVDKDTAKPEDYIDTEAIDIDYYRKMIAAESDNAFPHFFLANALMSLGEWDAAIDEYNKAGGSEYFSQPTTFPNRYIRQHALEIERGEGGFAKLSDRDKYTLWLLLGRDKLPNFIRVKDAYKNAQVGLNIGANANETLTALHKAACSMGASSEYLIYNLVAIVLIDICANQALIIGHDSGDSDLETAALAVMKQTALAKSRIVSLAKSHEDFQNEYLLKIKGESGANTGSDEEAPEDMEKAPDEIRIITYESDMLERSIAPMVKELAALDYSHPEVWYEKWYEMKSTGAHSMDFGDTPPVDVEGAEN